MDIKRIVFGLFAAAAVLVGCEPKEVDYGVAKIEVSTSTLSFEASSSSQTLQVTATRDWTVSGAPDWVAVDPASGGPSLDPQSVTVTVISNDGFDREVDLTFTIGLMKEYVKVSQKGQKGQIDNGKGTLESPFSVEGVIAYINSLDNPSTDSPEKVYVKGKISSIGEEYSTQYGNGTFDISDDGSTGTTQFKVYRAKYLGNKNYTSKDTQIKVGDDVIVYGNVVLYGSGAPVYETSQGNAYLYSLNGVTGGTPSTPGDPKGTGTKDDPFNVAAALKAVSGLSWTSNDNYEKLGPFYVKGKISSVKEPYGAQYGNGTFYISDDGEESNEFYVYRALYLGNQKFKEGDTQIKAGDEVIIYGELMNYHGNTPETVQNSSYLYSLNGETAEENPPQTEITSSTVADFIAKADESTYYRLTGKVSAFKTGKSNSGKDWMQFDLTDDTGSILVYGFKDGQFEQWADKIKDGGTVVLNGTYQFYEAKSQHEVMNATIESFTEGEGGGEEVTPSDIASIIASEDDTAVAAENVYVGAVTTKGYVATDGKNSIYVYGNAAPTVAVGDIVKFSGNKTTYYGMPEIESPKTTKTSSGTVTYPDPVDITNVFDTYNASEAVFVKYTATMTKSGNYTNFKVEGASKLVGALTSAPSAYYEGISEGDEVVVYGYFNGINTTNNLLNVIAVKIDNITTGKTIPSEGGDEPGGGEQQGNVVTIDLTAQGYENAQLFETLTVGDITLTGDKGTNNNAPKYYNTGSAVRFYGDNSLTVKSSGKNIKKIEFTFGSGDLTNEITSDSGNWATPTWTGDASSVKFTVGGTSGHRRVQKLVITLAE